MHNHKLCLSERADRLRFRFKLQMIDAATVVFLRTNPTSQSFEVLLGQNHVKNWLRSSQSEAVIMRYPGEWKFPGGVRDADDESLRHTAFRELQEEFLGIPCPRELKGLSKKMTRVIRGKQYCMYNFIALDEDNVWMQDDSVVDQVNHNLASKFDRFDESLSTGKYWELDFKEKEAISPEVHRVEWVDLNIAIERMGSAEASPEVCVDEWQQLEFSRHNVQRRDPMFQSMMVLKDILELGSVHKILDHCSRFEEDTWPSVLPESSAT